MSVPETTTCPVLRFSYDEDVDLLLCLVAGEVIDGHLEDETEVFAQLEEEESGELEEAGWFFRRGPGGPLIGFGVARFSAWDVEEELLDVDSPLWNDPRFDAPTLALRGATVGEIMLAAAASISGSTLDVVWFDRAVEASSDDHWERAERLWRRCLEVGEMKAHFGLGYTLVELGRPHEALGHLAMYTEICPRNGWAWVWRGRAATALGDTADAAVCFRRALECEPLGADETNAQELLDQLKVEPRGSS